MSTLLVLHASAAADRSHSRRLAADLLQRVQAAVPDLTLVERDLAALPLPGLTTSAVTGMFRPPGERTPAERSALSLSDLLIAELEAADAVLLTSPMYNYTVSTQLKAWVDQVVMPGRTFTYGPTGGVGALADRPVVVLTASGGVYGDLRAGEDFHTPYLRHVLGFIGLHDLTVVQVEGVIRDADSGYAAAHAQLPEATTTLVRGLRHATADAA